MHLSFPHIFHDLIAYFILALNNIPSFEGTTFYPLTYWRTGLPSWLSDKEFACRCRRCRFDSWVGKIPWSRKQPIPVFLSGKFQRQRSLAGYSLWGWKESDTAEYSGTHACISKSPFTAILGIHYFWLWEKVKKALKFHPKHITWMWKSKDTKYFSRTVLQLQWSQTAPGRICNEAHRMESSRFLLQ